jgi:hypothetical protein
MERPDTITFSIFVEGITAQADKKIKGMRYEIFKIIYLHEQ